jgi:molybdopterin synthase subunit MoaE
VIEISVRVTNDDADIAKLVESAKSSAMGAIVVFDGIVRDDDIEWIELSAYEEGALYEFEAIREDAIKKFGLLSVDIIHRTGRLKPGDNILIIVVGSPHRKDAFFGCEYILEEIKRRAPVWKKEFRKGEEQWVDAHINKKNIE